MENQENINAENIASTTKVNDTTARFRVEPDPFDVDFDVVKAKNRLDFLNQEILDNDAKMDAEIAQADVECTEKKKGFAKQKSDYRTELQPEIDDIKEKLSKAAEAGVIVE